MGRHIDSCITKTVMQAQLAICITLAWTNISSGAGPELSPGIIIITSIIITTEQYCPCGTISKLAIVYIMLDSKTNEVFYTIKEVNLTPQIEEELVLQEFQQNLLRLSHYIATAVELT